jgi:NAD(P)-dependent dehydrogenase (short-subunit alcohol dehydrogenase family)
VVSIKTSFARVSGATGRPTYFYSPTILGVRLLFFARLCYTIRMAEKIALITGTSSGFGLLTSIELAKTGFRVVATMRDLGRRDRLEQAIAAAGVRAIVDIRALDVTTFDGIQGFVNTVVRDYGRLDVLINNAGFAVAGFAEDIKLDELRLQFETNFFGAVAMSKAALPTMRRQGSGHIIQVSSIAGLHGTVSVSSYSASKHALEGWSESLRMEVNSLGIKVVLVEPGSFQTDIWTRGAVMGEDAKKHTSPNLQRSLRMREQIQKIPKADPITVARMIVAIAQNPNPKLRYLVGRDAKIQLAMKRILPWKWHEKIIANFLKID